MMKKSHSISVLAIFGVLFAAALWFGPMAEAQSFLVPKKESAGKSSEETTGGYRGLIAPRPLKEGETKQQATRPKYRIKKHVARNSDTNDAKNKKYQGLKGAKLLNRMYQAQSGLGQTVGKGHHSRGKARLADIQRLQKMGFDVKAHIPRPASMTPAEADAYEAAVKKERAKIKRLRRALETIDTFLEDQQY